MATQAPVAADNAAVQEALGVPAAPVQTPQGDQPAQAQQAL